MTWIAAIVTGATLASSGYCVLCIAASLRFAASRRQPPVTATLPPVSILKPLKGTDPEMYDSLRSYCLQDYPAYEILFGVSSALDAAVEVVEKLKREFPAIAMRLVLCEKKLGGNGKVSSLVQMVVEARHNSVVVSDSDIRVDRRHLAEVMAELHQPGVGLVTCLYRGVAANTVASQLEALGISTDFMPGVLVAKAIEGKLKFGLGATLAFRKRELEAIGGFEALVDYLADDYELGKRIAATGAAVLLSKSVVETFLPAYDLGGFFTHQLRWARTIRAARRAGYAGLLLTFTLPWAVLNIVLRHGADWTWAMLVGVYALRGLMAWITARRVLCDPTVGRQFWLLPIRDFLAVVVWTVGWFGNTIEWRGQRFRLNRGKLETTN
jgi:ceramide glucosyltransferase